MTQQETNENNEEVYRDDMKTIELRGRHKKERERRHERTNEAVPAREWELCDVREDSMSRDDERDAFALRSRSRRAATRGIVVGRRKRQRHEEEEDIKVREIMRGEDALHVSLSKVFPVRKEQREPYRSQLKASFNAFRRIEEDSILLVLLPLATTTRR